MRQEQDDFVTTAEFARMFKVKHQSVLRSLCLNGHYFGITPLTLPNGRHLWPANARDRLAQEKQEG